jgi:hypothetical protein
VRTTVSLTERTLDFAIFFLKKNLRLHDNSRLSLENAVYIRKVVYEESINKLMTKSAGIVHNNA